MDIKKMVRIAVSAGIVGGGAFAVVNTVAAKNAAQALLVPDCNCTVNNWPNPGQSAPGLRVDGLCYLDPCGS